MFEKIFGKKQEVKTEANVEVKTENHEPETVAVPVIENVTQEQVETPSVHQHTPPPLTYKEAKSLKKSKYLESIKYNSKFKQKFVLKNTLTGQIVELRAASSFHACNIIGWKPTRTQIIMVTDVEETKAESVKVA